MEATVQVNVRMNSRLKEEGDAALARIGLSPTQAIRALWERAAKRGEDLAQVEELLAPRPEAGRAEPDPTPCESSQRVYGMMDELYRQLGIDPTVKRERTMSDNELLYEEMCERLQERGLM